MIVCEDFNQRKTTKKGDRRKTAVPAFKPRARMISAIKLIHHEAQLMYDRNYMDKTTYQSLLSCLGTMAEYYRKDKRLPRFTRP